MSLQKPLDRGEQRNITMPPRKRRKRDDGKTKSEDDVGPNIEALQVASSPERTVPAVVSEGGVVSGTDDGNLADMAKLDPALLDEEEVPSASLSPSHPQAFIGGGHGSGGYNALKLFNGQYYSGMAIGGSHTWNYDSGVWKETKIEPDLWQIDYKTHKRRARNAPKGSGVPVGTEYHWYIVAHQVS